ncbi:elongation of very long chain fatty acids protein AAEL008004-like [Sabethes cyaneus]|uniref:elongation of very long chain fatty acids protein AAEL008004-like n=1 Tax=Sabethes cyaneus TaxID=53552 RepID=UPI00237D79F0|nr:elongation of very long chain fatty acids protein AAEL008004-like [Sabethes cyaneus]
MALVLKSFYCGYKRYFAEFQDPRTVNFPLVNPPWMPFALVGAYLYFVLRLGPKLMADRKPFNLKPLILVYNLVQVIANAALCVAATKAAYDLHISFKCQPVNRSSSPEAIRELQMIHCYYILKVADLVDTVFFVLRKKQSHVTFLHVYHHAGVLLGAYVYFRVVGGGHASMLGIWNTFVHAVMYFYFFLTVYRPELTRNANWKKYITILQMVQFAYLVVHFGLPVLFNLDCGIAKFWLWMPMIQNVFMFVLFLDFYRRTYGRRKAEMASPESDN